VLARAVASGVVSDGSWGRTNEAGAAPGAVPGVVQGHRLQVAISDDVDYRSIKMGHGRMVGMSDNDGLRLDPLLGQGKQHGLGDEPRVAEGAVPGGN
jgi:hypothetical protein